MKVPHLRFTLFNLNISAAGVCAPILPGGRAIISAVGQKKKKKKKFVPTEYLPSE